MLSLYRRWTLVLWPLLLIGTALHLWQQQQVFALRNWAGQPGLLAGAAVLLAGAFAAWAFYRRPAETDRRAALVALGLLVLLATLIAWLDVFAARGGRPDLWQAGNRVLHLLAFGAWAGGAIWNIFIAVPAGQARMGLDVVVLANVMLERFRWLVRGVFPVIITTGLLQAYWIFGWRFSLLFSGNLFGSLVLTKLGLILILVGIFLACPMWRACSPIKGVCNLDDLM